MSRVVYSAITSILIAASACGPVGPKPYEPYAESDTRMFMPSFRTTAAEPTYSRTRWAHLPQVLPEREIPGESGSAERGSVGGPPVRPVYQIALKGATLEETARVLGAMARYTSYTEPTLARRKFSVTMLGTIDEVAQSISDKAGIEVVIDHDNREVRFLTPGAEAPRLFSE